MTDAAEMKTGFEALTAESMPLVRKTFKVVGMVAFAFIWIAAMYMTLTAMLFRTEGQAWWVIVGMVALGIGADFWVGAGPVILRSSAKWGIKGWVVVGWITLIVALGFSFSNKLAYWVGISDRHEAAQIASNVDHLAADRELVAQNPHARVPAAVRAERDAAARAINAKEAEISSMPEEWPLRLRRAQRELLDLQTRHGALSGEYETAVAVAEAQERIDADRERAAIREAGAQTQTDPVLEWVIGLFAAFGMTLTPAAASIWLHASYSLFHELAQFSFLGLATLRIPLHKLEEEQEFLISQRRLHADKRVQMLATDVEKLTKIRMAQASFAATKKSIKQIADAEAELDTMRKMRDVERRKRAFLMEETPYDIPEGRLLEDMQDRPDPAEEAARSVIEAVVEAGGSAEAAAAAARAATQTSFKAEAAKDELSGDFVDYEHISYMRRKPRKKGDKLDRAVAGVKGEKRGPKNVRRFWNKDGSSTEMESGAQQDGGNRMASSPAGPIDVEALAQSLASEPEQGDEQQAESENAAREIVPAVDGEGAAEVQTELSDDDILLLGEPPVDAPDVSQDEPDSGEEDQQSQDETLEQTDPRGEPETDPARMIAAE